MNEQENVEESIRQSAYHIRNSDVLLIAAGAGMSVDSGIPDYYGGIHRAHPRIAQLGLNIYDLSNHQLFENNPRLAWGHWITRQREYINTKPHIGYHILYQWMKLNKFKIRIITTNLDQHFLRVGFTNNNVFEMHGSMYDAQCMFNCGVYPWTLNIKQLPLVDSNTMLLLGSIPLCIKCQRPARVCTSLAIDNHWNTYYVEKDRINHQTFFNQLSNDKYLTVLEIGCGTIMSKVRVEATRIVEEHRLHGGNAIHIRINLHQSYIDQHQHNISLPLTALEALQKINQYFIDK